jgi:hypothetical protein
VNPPFTPWITLRATEEKAVTDQADLSGFDNLSRNFLIAFSRRISRRSFFAKFGRGILGAVGLSVIYQVLPVNHLPAVAGTCDEFPFCGMFGRACCPQCAGGGSQVSCPATCTTLGGYWVACCCVNKECRYITYRDCCGPNTCQNCLHCSNTWNQHDFCDGTGQPYCCTLSIPIYEC